MANILGVAGFEVASAANGREALRYLRQLIRLPDLILLDLMMPELDGYEFLQITRRDARFATIPVCVISGSEPPIGLTTGVRRMNKPYRSSDLLAVVRETTTK